MALVALPRSPAAARGDAYPHHSCRSLVYGEHLTYTNEEGHSVPLGPGERWFLHPDLYSTSFHWQMPSLLQRAATPDQAFQNWKLLLTTDQSINQSVRKSIWTTTKPPPFLLVASYSSSAEAKRPGVCLCVQRSPFQKDMSHVG